MLEGDDILRIYVLDRPEAYLEKLLENIANIVIDENLPWFRFVYTINGREIIVRFYSMPGMNE